MTLIKTIQSAVIIASGVLFISQAQAVQLNGPSRQYTPKTCKTYQVKAMGSYMKKKKQARRNAIRKWMRTASRRDGSAYRSWQLASQKIIACELRGNETRCVAKARPCRSGVVFKQ